MNLCINNQLLLQFVCCIIFKIIYNTEIVDVLKFWTLFAYQKGLYKQFILKNQPDQASPAHVFQQPLYVVLTSVFFCFVFLEFF